MTDLEKEVKELKFKLKVLSNFVYEHHHKITSGERGVPDIDTSKAKVWVEYSDGVKEEPEEE